MPDLVATTESGIAPEVIGDGCPRERRGEKTVHHDYRRLAPVIRLHQIERIITMSCIGAQQASDSRGLQRAGMGKQLCKRRREVSG
jgi:hypothetical protein